LVFIRTSLALLLFLPLLARARPGLNLALLTVPLDSSMWQCGRLSISSDAFCTKRSAIADLQSNRPRLIGETS
jgi:hypothetical protein